MKKTIVFLCSIIMLMIPANPAFAGLEIIGTAGYDADGENGIESDEYFNLIWDADDAIVWFDYTHASIDWMNADYQMAWAADLIEDLEIQIYDGYSVTWTDDAWHLPDTEGEGWVPQGGYEQTLVRSDLSQLFYEELGNIAIIYQGTWGNPDVGLANTGPFENLLEATYLESTYEENPPDGWSDWIWAFSMATGYEDSIGYWDGGHGIAVRDAEVSAVPVPGAVWLLGSGLLGLIGIRRQRD
ncbi:MAG: hypothetical protein PVG39_20775 [Desulfobacteraceae bacterium]